MNEVKTEMLPQEKHQRGPGGHWFCYRAWRDGDPKEGFGQTALEATKDLQSKQ